MSFYFVSIALGSLQTLQKFNKLKKLEYLIYIDHIKFLMRQSRLDIKTRLQNIFSVRNSY